MNRNEMAKTQREVLGLTQKKFSEMSGINVCYISQYENGSLVSEEIGQRIHSALTSIRDKLYPEKTYDRMVYTFNLHCQLFGRSETFFDKCEYLNKIIRDATYMLSYIMTEKKQNDASSRNETWRRGGWR